MRDVFVDIDRWYNSGESVALATVIQTWGSAPRSAGAKMAVSIRGEISGSVSGGCIEGAVADVASEVIRSGRAQLLHFGVADDTAWSVGLACGGEIDVFVQPVIADMLHPIGDEADPECVTITVVRGSEQYLGRQMRVHKDGKQVGALGEGLDETALEYALTMLAEGRCRRVGIDEGIELFIERMTPPLTLVVVGGVHIAIPLIAMAKALGYRTVLVDPRRSFGSVERFPDVDLLLHSWPESALSALPLDESMAVAVLTHDPKLDDPALRVALPSSAFYVGALGSRSTNVKRHQRLVDAGMAADQLHRLHAPIGLDIGGRSPSEIALSVLAEIVEVQHKRDVAFF